MGYHRLFTHKSFKCVAPIRAALCIAGSMAAQGPVIFWVACHRKHHMYSDEADDPHSPHFAGGGLKGLLLGWWHSHVGWMLHHAPENYFRLAPDLLRDKLVVRLSKLYFVWVAAGIVIPGIVGGLVTRTAMGCVTGMLWGGLARIFIVHHTTWSINSICHMFGSAPFGSEDESRNNVACALLTFGEGWHNNHHAFPTSARHGLFWWQLDLVYLMIRGLERLGLATDIRVPDKAQIEARRRKK
jgi:stearoyl-CoA desaturase (delta-9 desaturase)